MAHFYQSNFTQCYFFGWHELAADFIIGVIWRITFYLEKDYLRDKNV